MDFGSLLYTAHKNEKSANKEVKCYKTKFEPPKKEAKPVKPNLSANIQKYLQKREEEEKRKAEEEKRKKEELIALRSQDKKAFKRVQTMLKRTKSANKSVMEDAIDDVNTVVTMAGPQQCDEDDYGYVSKEADEFYSKMMDKYANMPPEEPKFSLSKKAVPKDLNAAKDRVRAALQRAEEEEMMPHKRKRKSKSDKNDEGNHDEDDEDRKRRSRESSPVEEPKPKKPKKMAPPPLDFSSLLKIAEQKQFEPIKIEKKIEDEERPMTKRQKLEYERELESRRRKEEREAMRLAALKKGSKSSESSDKREKPNGLGRIPKKSTSDSRPKQNSETVRKSSVDSDNDQYNSSSYQNNDKQKSKYSSDTERPRNHYDGSNDFKKDGSILKSSLLKSDDRKPLKPTQPSIASNKIKSRTHNMSDDEQSESSQSGYEKKRSYSHDNVREHKSGRPSSQKEYDDKPSSGSERSYQGKNGYKKYSNMENEYTDSQSSSDSRKFQSSKPQSSSDSNHRKYKPEVKYKPDVEKYKPEKYKPSYPEKPLSKKPSSSSSIRERSYSPENSKHNSQRYSHNSRQSCSESEPENENEYRPSKKGDSSYSNSYRKKQMETEEDRSQSPDSPHYNKKRKDSYSDPESDHGPKYESPKKKPLLNKIKKISSLFEGSDDESSSFRDNGRKHKESENNKPKLSHDSNRQKVNENRISKSSYESEKQKPSSSDSKFKIPRNSKPEQEKSRLLENGRYKSSENSKPVSSSSSKPISKDLHKSHPENSKSERSNSKSRVDGDKSSISSNKSSIKPRSSTESSKTDSKENAKKPPEEVLKKSASVWSKPCNLSPASSAPRPPGGLSESQLQRLREMNKKPTASKPPEDKFRSENRSLSGKPSPREERKSDGRPVPPKPGPSLQGKQSLLMKAAAERGAMVKAQMAASRSSEPSSRPSEHKSLSKPSSTAIKSRDPPTRDSRPKQGEMKPKQFPPNDLKPKQFPPSDLKPRQFPPKDVRPRQFPPNDVKRKPKPRRIEDDSEDEYDSDMDSFIDDSTDLRPEDISREIQQIFGYDKSRYARIGDDDDECVESNFGQIDREELRSLRIGAKEDMEELMKDLARKKKIKQRKQAERGRR